MGDQHLAGKNHQKKAAKLENTEKESAKVKTDNSESDLVIQSERKIEVATSNMSIFKINHPDYPHKTDDMSIDDHYEAVKKYYKLKGLKYIDDFSDDEKRAIIEDATVEMI